MVSRTTLNLDKQILEDAQKLATDRESTLTKVVEEALREAVLRDRRNRQTSRQLEPLHTIGYSKLNPGIDFNNNAALRDLMDEEDGYSGR
jgi:hypothetical protein